MMFISSESIISAAGMCKKKKKIALVLAGRITWVLVHLAHEPRMLLTVNFEICSHGRIIDASFIEPSSSYNFSPSIQLQVQRLQTLEHLVTGAKRALRENTIYTPIKHLENMFLLHMIILASFSTYRSLYFLCLVNTYNCPMYEHFRSIGNKRWFDITWSPLTTWATKFLRELLGFFHLPLVNHQPLDPLLKDKAICSYPLNKNQAWSNIRSDEQQNIEVLLG